MNTKITFLAQVLATLWLIPSAFAQSTYRIGGLPSLNLNLKLNNDWSLNTKLESRQQFRSGEWNGKAIDQYEYLLTDLSLIAAKKIGLNSRLAGGYLVRSGEGEWFHRFIQQFVVVQKLSGFRLAHRILSDQTFSKHEKPGFRFRYRISSEIPLNGESVDEGELYLKINNEYINSLQAMEYDLEIRLTPLLGYDITESFKIETGPDYRINSFINGNTRHSIWMMLNFFIEI
ncbi:MAG TPA: DUF2490 domain-containing protein [Saprospiraceae bacterium]|nr:DUF2490 domain-containing protein [Saprospiraceae bacterium]HNT20194.1 DUF2490 domain-containing protein [Saprospiraceae bacterium]